MAVDPLEVPQSDSEDVAHIAVSTILSTIPFLGVGELFKFIVAPSLEKRRDHWMQAVADAVRELQQRNSLDMNKLAGDEEFITLLLQATQVAYKTHLESKHTMLKEALISAVQGGCTFDKKQSFLNLIDRLTPSHITLLKIVERYQEDTKNMDSVQEVFSKAANDREFEDVTIDTSAALIFLADLEQAGLIVATEGFITSNEEVDNSQYLLTEASGTSGLPRLITTRFAHEFITFIGL